MAKKQEKPSYNVAQNAWFMVKLAWTTGERKVILLCLLTAILAVATNLVNLYISPAILSAVERHVSLGELLATILGFVLAMMAVNAVSAYVGENVLWGRISVRMEVMKLVNKKAVTTSYPNVENDTFRKLLAGANEATENNYAAAEHIWTSMTNLTQNILGFVFYIGLLTWIKPVLFLVVLVTSIMSFYLSYRLEEFNFKRRMDALAAGKRLQYLLKRAEDLSTAKDVRIFGLVPWIREVYQKADAAYVAFSKKGLGYIFWVSVADLVFAVLRNGLAYAYLIGLVLTGAIDVPTFMLYFGAVSGFTQWITGILKSYGDLHLDSIELCPVREVLTFPEQFRFEDGEPLVPEQDKAYEIKLENVSFRYPGAETYALKHINLTLHPGEKLAVVGLNGAGKTTLVKIICGFYDPTEGRVLLNGKDIRDYNRRDYYTIFSAVFQTFSILAGTIAVNVAQDDTNIDMERVKAAVEQAGLKAKIESLPKGYETNLEKKVYDDATNLSGGETQRLMLARAIYKDAPFLILDEPTAALDPIAESEMYLKYNEVAGGHSSVYISHRLASTRFCDRILMLADGGIAEEGTHETLLRRGGKYAELFHVQSRYYQEGDREDAEN